MTGEEVLRRVRSCLAELGYGDCPVELAEELRRDGHPEFYVPFDVPSAVLWQATFVTYPHVPCWSCWFGNSHDHDRALACSLGDCRARPGELRKPPRELLVSA